VANTLKLYRNGAVGFIDWLDRVLSRTENIAEIDCAKQERPRCHEHGHLHALSNDRENVDETFNVLK
jgi:hypothetical protein